MDNVYAYLVWLRPLCKEVGLEKHVDLAKECGVSESAISMNLSGQQFGSLHEILRVVIIKGASTSKEEMFEKLELIEHTLKGKKGGANRKKRIEDTITEAFANRPPAPERKTEKMVLSQEQFEKIKVIARIIDELRDDGLPL